MPSLPYIEAVETLHLVACPQCHIKSAMPEEAYLAARLNQSAIYCPAGHSHVPAADGETSNDGRRCMELLAKLADVRLKLTAAEARLQLAGTAAAEPFAAKEIRRRCRILAGRADGVRGEVGKAICVFCGAAVARSALHRHLRRQHAEQISGKPVSYFDAATDRLLARLG